AGDRNPPRRPARSRRPEHADGVRPACLRRQGLPAAPEFPRPDANSAQNGGQFVRQDIFGGGNPGGATGQFPAQGRGQGTGQFPMPGRGQDTGQYPAQGRGQDTGQFPAPGRAQDPAATGQYPAQGYDASGTGQFAAPGYGNRQDSAGTGQFERPQPAGDGYGTSLPPAQHRPQQQPPRRQEPEALPPAPGPGDGRTPLYDTLETNWFRGQGQGQQPGNGSAPQAPQQQPQPSPAAPQRPAAAGAAWRTSPNDDLVRQAERVRQPAAGGITTSGLPRRVPRANLVPGTAQQQQHQTGPQVSRSPDDVRGRLTNLRRGIAQGRQAGTGQTGSFPSPTHQQER
ncbi:nitrate- and nitrite sensing domain-containing protein, partial [Streptomyces sp. NPDC001215]